MSYIHFHIYFTNVMVELYCNTRGMMGKPTGLVSEFNKTAGILPKTDFVGHLRSKFDVITTLNILDEFQKMGLPLPQGKEEFLSGLEGVLVFLNKYGLVIRLEVANFRRMPKLDSSKTYYNPDRIDDNAWILKPLASLKVGMAVIEICPGCHQETKIANNEYLRKKLEKQGLEFWDYKLSNVGRVPVKTVRFPEGIPVVIDRGALNRLTDSIKPVRELLVLADQEAAEAQESLYAPLRQAFDDAWPDTVKMKQFWKLCRSYVREGKLVAGWNEPQPPEVVHEKCEFGDNTKTPRAAEAAKHYAVRLQSSGNPVSSAVAVVLRSLHLPV